MNSIKKTFQSITGKAVLSLVLTYKPDFNTGKAHPHRHHCLNFLVCFIYIFLLPNLPSHSVSKHYHMIFTLHPVHRCPSFFRFQHFITRCFQLHTKSSSISLPKERVSSITAQSEEWQKLQAGRLISFFSGRTSAGKNR